MSTRTHLTATVLLAAFAVGACSAGASGGGATPTTAQSPGVTSAPSVVEGIVHPTGASDIVLRLDESGGFVPAEFLAAHVPQFTLYGDGTVVFVSSSEIAPERNDGVMTGQPVKTATLTEAQVQDLLEYALRNGGLGAARADYQNPLVADAPTAVFTINADGATKTVSVVALGMDDPQPNADTAIKKALGELGGRLRDFDAGGSLTAAPYTAAAYEGVLTAQEGLEGVQFRDWPWTDLTPADFTVPNDPNVLPQGRATLTPEQAAALGVDGYESGIGGGVYLRDDEGKTYTFVLRPVLPDEAG
jgi:hypothetical protein